MFDKPIISITQAKECFKFFNCSSFFMAREFPERYNEYRKLNIPKALEKSWTTELLNELYIKIIEENETNSLWSIHARMYDLVESLKTDEAINKMLLVTRFIQNKVKIKDKVIIAETINGRSDRRYRSGLIYLAFDLNNKRIAKAFIELSLYFSEYTIHKSLSLERCQKATQLCNDIKIELGL